MQALVTCLIEAGIQPSMQRIKVLEYFHDHKNHPTADQIFCDLKKEIPTLSKATVYNTLGLFLEKELINATTADEATARYDLSHSDHGHFVCTSCHEIYDFPYHFSQTYSDLEGFQIRSEEIIVKGICKKCLEDKKEELC